MIPYSEIGHAAARRQYFPLLLMKAFETLHPAVPPLELTCHELALVLGEEKRLAVTVPPRHQAIVDLCRRWRADRMIME